MKVKGLPNEAVTMPIGDLRFQFDTNGVFDLDKFIDNFKEKFVSRVTVKFPIIPEEVKAKVEVVAEPPKEVEEVKEVKKLICKVCGKEFDNAGLFLVHAKEHKKEDEINAIDNG